MRRGALPLLATLLLAAPAAARDLAAVHYDLLLAEYCALLDAAVIAGWEAEVADVVAAEALDEAAQRAAASEASIHCMAIKFRPRYSALGLKMYPARYELMLGEPAGLRLAPVLDFRPIIVEIKLRAVLTDMTLTADLLPFELSVGGR